MNKGLILVGVVVAGLMVGCDTTSGTSSTTTTGATASTSSVDSAAAAWAVVVSGDADTLSSDFTTFSTDASADDFAASAEDCAAILVDVAGFQTDITSPPSIFTQVAATLGRSLQEYNDACNNVISGVADMDGAQITAAASEMTQGTTLMNQANSEIVTALGS